MAESIMSGPTGPPGVTGQPRLWLRAEGAVASVVGIAAWSALNGGDVGWLIFWVLAVDVSMVGYFVSPRLGALTYNVAHNWATALAVLLAGFLSTTPPIELMGVILVVHVGVDRALGYGLKYPTSFQDTHLGRIGRNRR